MSAPDPKKVKEAEALVKKGESAAKKSFFHKPDFDDAAAKFGQAADIFWNLNLFNEAKEAFEKAADAWDKAELQNKSGELYVNAANAAHKAGQREEVVRLLREGKVRYLEGGQALQAVRQLKEAAQKVKAASPELACDIYEELLDIVEAENQYHWEKESFLDYALLRLEMKDYEGCLKAWERAEKAFLHLKNNDTAAHCVVSAIAVELVRGDIVAAENRFNKAMQDDYFTTTEDFSMIDMIVRGVKNHDGDLLEIGQKSFILEFLKPEIARIICSFKAPKSVKPEEEKGKEGAKEEAPAQDENEEAEEDDGAWLL